MTQQTIQKTSIEIVGLPIQVIKGDELIMELDFVKYSIKYNVYLDSISGQVIEINDYYPYYAQDTNGKQVLISQISDYLVESCINEIIQEEITNHFAGEIGEKFLVKFMDE